MPPSTLPPPILVADEAGLRTLVGALAACPVVAVDTESNSLHAYRERVCLIQFSTPAADYIVDPIGLRDLRPLAPFFANPGQQKVFHAAEYDLICLRRDYGFEFTNIFDTMSAARTLGWPQVGLAAILDTHFGVTMNKKYPARRLETPSADARTAGLRAARHALSAGAARPAARGADRGGPHGGSAARNSSAWRALRRESDSERRTRRRSGASRARAS